MGDFLQWNEVRDRVTGKWQIPAVALSLVTLGLSIATYRTPTSKIPFEALRDEIPRLIDGGLYTTAIDVAGKALQAEGLTLRDLAPIYASVGQARILRAERNDARVASIALDAIGDYERATSGEYELTPRDHELIGKAFDWSRQFASALEHYDLALLDDPMSNLDLRRRTIELRADRMGASSEVLHAELSALLADAIGRPDLLIWALDRDVDALVDLGRADDARSAIQSVGMLIEDESRRKWLLVFDAQVLLHMQESDRAEAILRDVLNGLDERDELFARATWLLGRTVLGVGSPERPQEAITFFERVLSAERGVYGTASRVGMAEALIQLQRFDEAADLYDEALREMRDLPPHRHINPVVIESSLLMTSRNLRAGGLFPQALRFARFALDVRMGRSTERRAMLLEHLADSLAAAARAEIVAHREISATDDPASGDGTDNEVLAAGVEVGGDQDGEHSGPVPDSARKLLLEAASTMREVAMLYTLPLDRRMAASWRAAQLSQESTDLEATADAMESFAFAYSESPYVSRALRYRGRALQSLGRFEEAIDAYRENIRRFTRTPDAGSSLIPLARCLIALGPDYAGRAEKALAAILENSEVFTPEAQEFSDALFLLGDLLNRSGEFERAVPVLEEAMARYPDDSRAVRARFLLADCYRQSGVALQEDFRNASFTAERERIVTEQRDRLRKAAELFDETIDAFELRNESLLSPLDTVYLRHARLYLGDCHFELGEYDRALVRYERAAWIYKGTATALAAYVQIINSHFFSGNAPEAAAAVRRALYLVETMPDSAFEDGVRMESRDDWRDYFEWVRKSQLF